MSIQFFNVWFQLSMSRVDYGHILIRRFFSVNEQKVGTKQLNGFWEWQPQCCYPSTSSCKVESLKGVPVFYGCITAEEIQRPMRGGWRWQIDGPRSHILLTKDNPMSKDVVGALSDVKWVDFFTLKGHPVGFWILRIGSLEVGGEWSASSQVVDAR